MLHAVNFPKTKFTYHKAIQYYTENYNEPRDHYTNMANFWRFTTIYTKEWLKKMDILNIELKYYLMASS